jgi:hypothetical protein
MITPHLIDVYPYIKKAALILAYDNDMINREEPEDLFLANCAMSLASVTHLELIQLDEWLQTLTDEQMETLVCGEESEMRALEALCPTGGPDNQPLSKIFDDIFESA